MATGKTAAAKKATGKKIKLTLVRSRYSRLPRHRATLEGLGGLQRINQSVVLNDTPAIRGMVNLVAYMLRVEEVS
ncbi:MAG: 50S ribosomal protein L30 [Gammaproteobacteria bacterium]|nr:50S ribosomal protein L30 [Gammaproteobacteria bacterium]MCL5669238.1 50S ribosomal protein L30 [Gammaproteobacteria bacterium]